MRNPLKTASILILLGSAHLQAQENLIVNPSLEEVNTFNLGSASILYNKVIGWSSRSTTDMFSEQAIFSDYRVPNNILGQQMAKDGINYCGSIAGVLGNPNDGFVEENYGFSRENVIMSLKRPLAINKVYRFTCSASLAECSSGIFDKVFIVPFDTDPKLMPDWMLKEYYRKYRVLGQLVSDSINWQTIEINFRSAFNAKFIEFGLVDSLSRFQLKKLPLTFADIGLYLLTYYYFDDFSLKLLPETLSSELTLPNTFTPNGDQQNDVWRPIANNIASYALQVFNRYGALVY